MKRLILIFSDIEAGGGTATDDFVEDDLLCQTIKENFIHQKKYPTDLILNGDTFDFMKCPYKGSYPRHITENISLGKLEKIIEAHPLIFKTLAEFLASDKRARIIFVHGNHDFDLVYPRVQEKMKELLAGNDLKMKKRILFPGFEYEDGLLLVEHGSQLDKFFTVDPKKLVYFSKTHFIGEPFLLFPWGYNALYDHFIHIKEEIPLMERLMPRMRAFNILPKKYQRRILFGTGWYMVKSFCWTQFTHWDDKLYRFHPKEFLVYFRNLTKKRFELRIVGPARRKLRKSKYKVLAIGHSHISNIYRIRKKVVLNTGNWRDEYVYSRYGKKFIPKQKSYGFILLDKKEAMLKLIKVPSGQKEITVQEIKEMLKKN